MEPWIDTYVEQSTRGRIDMAGEFRHDTSIEPRTLFRQSMNADEVYSF